MPYGDAKELFPSLMLEQAREVITICARRDMTIATAESCTGGLIASILTEISGASQVFTHGFITYANPAKTSMIDVPAASLASHGAVSEIIARSMAEGALRTAMASIAVGVTGIAGPTGGTEQKPVGLVHIACASQYGTTQHKEFRFDGSRTCIRLKSVEAALGMMLKQLEVI